MMESSKQSRKHGREVDEEQRDKAHHADVQKDARRLRQQRRRALETTEQRDARLKRQRIKDEQRRAQTNTLGKTEKHR